MTATRVTWGQAFWAVVGATIMTAFGTLLPLILFEVAGLPFPTLAEGASGRGWPWRIEGPWSLAADIGPLVLVGGVFAMFAESFTSKHAGTGTRRLPIALTAALLGWVMFNRPTNAGLIGVSGLATFLALVVVTREMSGRRRRPWHWTPRTVWPTVVLVLALTLATLSYSLLHPLSSDQPDATVRGGIAFNLRNDGRADVRVLSVAVPLVETRALVDPAGTYEYSPDDPDLGMVPVTGKTITDGASLRVTLLRAPDGCTMSRSVDRLNLRVRVLGRTVDQVVRVAPVSIACD